MKKFYSHNCFNCYQIFFYLILPKQAFFDDKSNFFLVEKIFFKKQKYIVFLIFFLPSIYFFKRKNYVIFGVFLLFQIFTIIYWQSLILWIRDLAGDSLSEIDTLNIYFIVSWFGSIFNYLKPKLDFDSFIKVLFFRFFNLFFT